MAAHRRTDSPLQAGEIAGFEYRTAGLQSGVTTKEPPLPLRATTTPWLNNLGHKHDKDLCFF